MKTEFSEWLSMRRAEKGWSKRRLASELSVTVAWVHRVETGEKSPSELMIFGLSKIFDIEEPDLFHIAKILPASWGLKVVSDLELLRKLASM